MAATEVSVSKNGPDSLNTVNSAQYGRLRQALFYSNNRIIL